MNLTGRVGHLVSARSGAGKSANGDKTGDNSEQKPFCSRAAFPRRLADLLNRPTGCKFSSPVGTFLFSLSSFMPAASAMVSAKAAKSLPRYSFGFFCNVAAPK